jgi:excisionase family DNA binding protein
MQGNRKLRPTGTPDTCTAPAFLSTQCEVLTVTETAALLKVPPSSIYEWTRYRGSHRGTPLPHRKVGKYLRFLRSEVDTWIVGLPHAANLRKRRYTRKPSEDDAPLTASSTKARPRNQKQVVA